MKKIFRNIFLIVIGIGFCFVGTATAQTASQLQNVKQSLNGQKFFVSYRDGGAVYGTYVFQEVHFCPSGEYLLYGQSRRETILGNEQVNNWQDFGKWSVISFQGQAAVQYLSTTGSSNLIPVQLLPDGRLWVREGLTIQNKGAAQCR